MEVLHDMSLKRYNTFNIDVTAKDFVSLQSVDELQQFLSIHALNKEKFMILGGGSNILFTADYDGTIVQIAIPGKKIIQKSKDHVLVQVMAGENWDEFVSWCIDKGLGGLENLSGIPGLVGASPIQNIGAYGVEMQDHFITLEAIEANTGVVREFPLDSCSFGYRDSVFKKELKDKFIILSTTFSLDKKPLYNLSYRLFKDLFCG